MISSIPGRVRPLREDARKVVSEELHDLRKYTYGVREPILRTCGRGTTYEGRILVRLLGKRVELGDRVVESELGEEARLSHHERVSA